jgi:hypothetical protein
MSNEIRYWYVAEWNPEKLAYVSEEYPFYNRYYFKTRLWIDAKMMALSVFGREPPNNANWIARDKMPIPKPEETFHMVEKFETGIIVQVITSRPSVDPMFGVVVKDEEPVALLLDSIEDPERKAQEDLQAEAEAEYAEEREKIDLLPESEPIEF